MLEYTFAYILMFMLLCLALIFAMGVIFVANVIFELVFDRTIPEFFDPCWQWIKAKLKGENK